MTVSTPPRPPSPARVTPDSEPLSRDEIEALVEALIEEARQETRRRRRRYWAVAALVTFVGVVVVALLEGGAASQTAPAGRIGAVERCSTGGNLADCLRARRRSGPPCMPVGRCDRGLYVMNADGTGLRRLTRNAVLGAGADPVWSPDGRKLVFVKRPKRSGATCGPVGRCKDEIYVINADGTGLRRLTRNTVSDEGPSGHRTGGRSPSCASAATRQRTSM